MTGEEFTAFIAALRTLMLEHGQDPGVLDVVEILPERSKARLPFKDGTWFAIYSEHLNATDGTMRQIAAAVYDAYREDQAR